MPLFTFTARDPSGRTQNGLRQAVSASAAMAELRAADLLVLELLSVPDGAGGAPRGRTSALDALGLRVFGPRSIDVETSLQQLAVMLKAGLPLVAALRTCAEHAPRRSMRRLWTDVGERIKAGSSLSDAMAGHRAFPRLVVTMVSVGEQTGVLDEVLARGAAAMERRRLLASGVNSALIYPAIVVVMAIGAVAFMIVGLIPKLRSFLTAFGRTLPPLTQALLDVSAFVETRWAVGLAALAVAALSAFAVYRWPPGRAAFDRALFRVPVAGELLRLSATSTFARTLSTLLASGVRLTDALRVAEPLHGNTFVASRIAAAGERVRQGSALSEPLGEGRAFTPMLPAMVAVGEASGALDEVLAHVASFHEARLEAVVRRLSMLIEPALILVVGGIVAFVYLACFMAIYAIAGNQR